MINFLLRNKGQPVNFELELWRQTLETKGFT